MRISTVAVLLFALLPASAYADKVKVVASFSILGDMVQQIAGELADITVLVGPDADAHAYEPTPVDAKLLTGASLVVVNGLGFEGWLGRMIMASGYTGNVVSASAGVNSLTFKDTLRNDPHAWQSLTNGRIYAVNIRDGLIKADKAHESVYTANAAKFIKEMDALDKQVTEQIEQIPDYKRKVISNHDAFQYFANAYHVTFLAPQGMNPESAPTAADIARMIDLIKSEHVQALFMENISDSRLIRQLETDSGAHIGGTLYSDALSAPDGPAGTYLAMFSYNAAQLAQAMNQNPDKR